MNRADESTIRGLLEHATATIDTDTARLDAEVLLASLLKLDRSYLYAWPDKQLPEETCREYAAHVQRRARGEPIAYLTGMREFWSLPLDVNDATLIPRPETEVLVTRALARIAPRAHLNIADLGTGSGAIALALAYERPRCHVLATDSCADALAVARGNAAKLKLNNLSFVIGNWCQPLPTASFDVIVSNPPYIEEQDKHLQQGDARFEPRTSLAAGPDGMRDLEEIITCARPCLRKPGWLLLEHGFQQAEQVRNKLMEHGYTDICSFHDDAGLERVSAGKISP